VRSYPHPQWELRTPRFFMRIDSTQDTRYNLRDIPIWEKKEFCFRKGKERSGSCKMFP